jgi:uncharacterized protein YhfF
MTTSDEHAVPDLDQSAAERMWTDYLAAHPGRGSEQPPSERFGDSPALADELLALVMHGPKRATAGAVADYQHAGELLPRIGDHWIVHDGSGAPQVILRSIELRIGPLDSVDDAFAWDEGEDDRTRQSWMDGHSRYFRRTLGRIDVEFHDRIEVVFERFRVVWPPELADD